MTTCSAWVISHANGCVVLSSIRASRAEAWWAVQEGNGKTRRDLQKSGFRAEKVLLVRPEPKPGRGPQ